MAMKMKLHGSPFSSCTTRVLACFHEKEITDFELVPVNLMAGSHKQLPYLTLNPFGQIPALEDEDFTLFESRAITRYLSKKYEGQGTNLLGKTLREQAIVDEWCEVESHQFNPPCSAIIREVLVTPFRGGKTDEAVVQSNVEKLNTVLDVYEQRLSTNLYLGGDFFSLADLHHLPCTEYLVNAAGMGNLISSRPHLNAWWQRISSRPGWNTVKQSMKR